MASWVEEGLVLNLLSLQSLQFRVSPTLGLQDGSEHSDQDLWAAPPTARQRGEPTALVSASCRHDFQCPSRPQGRGQFCSDRSRERRA